VCMQGCNIMHDHIGGKRLSTAWVVFSFFFWEDHVFLDSWLKVGSIVYTLMWTMWLEATHLPL